MGSTLVKISLAIGLVLSPYSVFSQVLQFGGDNEDLSIYSNEITEFTWMRGQYTNYQGGRSSFSRRGWWDTDYPDSDENFLRGVMRYTNVETNPSK